MSGDHLLNVITEAHLGRVHAPVKTLAELIATKAFEGDMCYCEEVGSAYGLNSGRWKLLSTWAQREPAPLEVCCDLN